MSIQANFPNLKPSLLLDFANTKQLDNRVTFTRSTPAVYYDGKTTAMAEQNLLQQSQTFTSPWQGFYGSITSSTVVAPDGTSTAVTYTPTAQYAALAQPFATIVGQQYTYSVYIKRPTGSNSLVFFNNAGNAILTFTPTTSWVRYTATFTATTTSETIYIQDRNASGQTAWDLWGAQAEQRASATAYTATTTQAITNYIPVLLSAGGNQPRFDCNPTTGESLGLLIEEQRTNLFTYSSQFDDSGWSKSASTVTANTVIAPDGTLSGDTLIEDATNAQHFISKAGSIQSGSVTLSIYAKAAGRDWIRIQTYSGVMAWFNISTGVLGTVQSGCTATITSVGNGWYRCAATVTYVNQTNYVFLANADGVTSYTGNGFSGVHIWGAQVEAGAFASSYIATTSASATRTADTPIITGNNLTSWYSNNIGTIYASLSVPSSLNVFSNSAATLFSMGSGRVTSRIINTGYAVAILDQVGGGITTANSVNLNSENKTATSFSQGNYSICLNNGTVVSTTSATIVQPATQLLIGFDAYDNRPNTPIRKIAYYPSVLTNAQLQALTS